MIRRKPLLLDTHVLLWWLIDDPTLSDEVKSTLDEELDVHVSAAVVWEIGIKQALGKLETSDNIVEYIGDNFYELPIDYDHAQESGRLPPIHRDPFDRMLIAQARCERMTLVTRDENIRQYDVPTLAV